MSAKTVLIGLDGATFTILNPLVQKGIMPNLGLLIREGVSAELTSIVPALTPPAWTSILTGKGPGQHGIFDFFERESPRSHNIRLVTSRDIRGDSLWTLANHYGKRTIALNFPLSFPPPPIDGYVVPGWMPWRQLRLGCHPPELYDRIKALPGFDARKLAMDMATEEKALEGCSPDEYADWIELHIQREQQWLQILKMLLAEDSCDLVTLLFDGIDKIQHLFWRFIDPAYAHTLTAKWEQAIRTQCLGYYAELDLLLGELLGLVGPDADVVIASDHGFGAQVRTFFVNAWLKEQGYLAWNQAEAPQSKQGQTLGVGQIARHVYQLDWERTRAYAPLPSGNGIHIVTASADNPHGVPAGEYESFRDDLIQGLRNLRDPQTGAPVCRQIFKREQIFAGPKLDLAPDLTLVLEDGGLISILDAAEIVLPRSEPSGTHRPQGIFIAYGKSFAKRTRLPALSLLDIAPTMLYSMGLPIPDDLDGTLPLQALDPETVATHPPRYRSPVTASDDEASPDESNSGSDLTSDLAPDQVAENEAAVLSRLKALGYIE